MIIWVVSNICSYKQYCSEHLCASEWDLLEMECLDDLVRASLIGEKNYLSVILIHLTLYG